MVNKFEDLRIWKKAIELDKDIHFMITTNQSISKDYGLKDQMNRSVGSIADNIAEGFERDGNKEFHQFLMIAKGSAGELRSQLTRSFERNYITKDEFDVLNVKCLELSGSIRKLSDYLRQSEMKGRKYQLDKNQQQALKPET